MKRQIEGETWAAPIWTHCMEYEFELRRDAMKLCRARVQHPSGAMGDVP